MKQKKKLTLVRMEELEADVLELPYENEQLSMIVVVPTEDSDVRKLEANMENFHIGKINDRLDQVTELFLLENIKIKYVSST